MATTTFLYNRVKNYGYSVYPTIRPCSRSNRKRNFAKKVKGMHRLPQMPKYLAVPRRDSCFFHDDIVRASGAPSASNAAAALAAKESTTLRPQPVDRVVSSTPHVWLAATQLQAQAAAHVTAIAAALAGKSDPSPPVPEAASRPVPLPSSQQQALSQSQPQTQPRSQHQGSRDPLRIQNTCIEFDHAINYVTTVKHRFANDPDNYEAFLEILQKYQKEQRGAKEVLDDVSELFSDHPDLLKEFTLFLPGAVQAQAKAQIDKADAVAKARKRAAKLEVRKVVAVRAAAEENDFEDAKMKTKEVPRQESSKKEDDSDNGGEYVLALTQFGHVIVKKSRARDMKCDQKKDSKSKRTDVESDKAKNTGPEYTWRPPPRKYGGENTGQQQQPTAQKNPTEMDRKNPAAVRAAAAGAGAIDTFTVQGKDSDGDCGAVGSVGTGDVVDGCDDGDHVSVVLVEDVDDDCDNTSRSSSLSMSAGDGEFWMVPVSDE
eukprot:CAMPEP_0194324768 /NCGR_PEP_ID=MMETSP0171-20130528/28845_1 /TAXON_ID=218684 /ORGANISM="Corethron pennatum, Strain L29A3" /LENGTH=486 /DNA_ID=CAMNT_0039083743 /DNA_START=384 /DNA_END=1844 /DNA_ORIENTATION=-